MNRSCWTSRHVSFLLSANALLLERSEGVSRLNLHFDGSAKRLVLSVFVLSCTWLSVFVQVINAELVCNARPLSPQMTEAFDKISKQVCSLSKQIAHLQLSVLYADILCIWASLQTNALNGQVPQCFATSATHIYMQSTCKHPKL